MKEGALLILSLVGLFHRASGKETSSGGEDVRMRYEMVLYLDRGSGSFSCDSAFCGRYRGESELRSLW